MAPASLNGFERYCLIQSRQADQAIDCRGQHRSLAESQAKDGRDQIEVGGANQTPVQASHYQKHCSSYVQSSHFFLQQNFSIFSLLLLKIAVAMY
jgi:hypothetical protein